MSGLPTLWVCCEQAVAGAQSIQIHQNAAKISTPSRASLSCRPLEAFSPSRGVCECVARAAYDPKSGTCLCEPGSIEAVAASSSGHPVSACVDERVQRLAALCSAYGSKYDTCVAAVVVAIVAGSALFLGVAYIVRGMIRQRAKRNKQRELALEAAVISPSELRVRRLGEDDELSGGETPQVRGGGVAQALLVGSPKRSSHTHLGLWASSPLPPPSQTLSAKELLEATIVEYNGIQVSLRPILPGSQDDEANTSSHWAVAADDGGAGGGKEPGHVQRTSAPKRVDGVAPRSSDVGWGAEQASGLPRAETGEYPRSSVEGLRVSIEGTRRVPIEASRLLLLEHGLGSATALPTHTATPPPLGGPEAYQRPGTAGAASLRSSVPTVSAVHLAMQQSPFRIPSHDRLGDMRPPTRGTSFEKSPLASSFFGDAAVSRKPSGVHHRDRASAPSETGGSEFGTQASRTLSNQCTSVPCAGPLKSFTGTAMESQASAASHSKPDFAAFGAGWDLSVTTAQIDARLHAEK